MRGYLGGISSEYVQGGTSTQQKKLLNVPFSIIPHLTVIQGQWTDIAKDPEAEQKAREIGASWDGTTGQLLGGEIP